jgi:hypothetical protein
MNSKDTNIRLKVSSHGVVVIGLRIFWLICHEKEISSLCNATDNFYVNLEINVCSS